MMMKMKLMVMMTVMNRNDDENDINEEDDNDVDDHDYDDGLAWQNRRINILQAGKWWNLQSNPQPNGRDRIADLAPLPHQ